MLTRLDATDIYKPACHKMRLDLEDKMQICVRKSADLRAEIQLARDHVVRRIERGKKMASVRD